MRSHRPIPRDGFGNRRAFAAFKAGSVTRCFQPVRTYADGQRTPCLPDSARVANPCHGNRSAGSNLTIALSSTFGGKAGRTRRDEYGRGRCEIVAATVLLARDSRTAFARQWLVALPSWGWIGARPSSFASKIATAFHLRPSWLTTGSGDFRLQNLRSVLICSHAIVAVEDARFEMHHGVDWKSVAAAAWQDVSHLSSRRGASTLDHAASAAARSAPHTL